MFNFLQPFQYISTEMDRIHLEILSNFPKFEKLYNEASEGSYEKLSLDFQREYGFERDSFMDILNLTKRQEGILEKDDEKSKNLREAGNAYYKSRNRTKALQWYYKAIGFAKTDEVRGKCYSNLVALFMNKKQYQRALEYIQSAKDTNVKVHQKLIERETICMNMLENRNTVNFLEKLPLTYDGNSKNSQITGCIRLGENGGLFSTRDLKVGDVIATTEAFVVGAERSLQYYCYSM